ncbi:unnamed protein product [Paramecium octaurelia]|uniref:Uncharacterized protein n=1 Tax=Paramecium octaurelia TaxID=43137 RepID=A0A8S1WLD3_PAROT|nr:unnamed protein product [Paramecium octaurelia]
MSSYLVLLRVQMNNNLQKMIWIGITTLIFLRIVLSVEIIRDIMRIVSLIAIDQLMMRIYLSCRLY